MSDSPAAIRATFIGYSKSERGTHTKLIFEVPAHEFKAALEALGTPQPETTLWCAIAAIGEEHAVKASNSPAEQPSRKGWYDMPPTQRAVLLCKNEAFWAWLADMHYPDERAADFNSEEAAAEWLCAQCKIESRADLRLGVPNVQFAAIEQDFRQWAGLEASPDPQARAGKESTHVSEAPAPDCPPTSQEPPVSAEAKGAEEPQYSTFVQTCMMAIDHCETLEQLRQWNRGAVDAVRMESDIERAQIQAYYNARKAQIEGEG